MEQTTNVIRLIIVDDSERRMEQFHSWLPDEIRVVPHQGTRARGHGVSNATTATRTSPQASSLPHRVGV